MQFSILIDQKRAMEWGMNISEATVFSLYSKAAIWAEPQIVNNQVFYFVCRHKVADELPILKGKKTASKPSSDAVYRINKNLHEMGVILYKKVGVKDCILITDKGKKWNQKDKQSTSEMFPSKPQNSEINPNELGNVSESTSEMFPTYQGNYIDQGYKDQREATSSEVAPPQITEECIKDFDEQVKEKRKRFVKPTLKELQVYFQKKFREKKVLGADKIAAEQAEKFLNHYESNGWMVGKTKMRSWPHAVGGWISRMPQYETQVNSKPKQNGIDAICSKETAAELSAAFAAGGYRW